MLHALRSGHWLTCARIRAYASIFLLGYVAAGVVLVATSQGGVDVLGRPVGTDYAQVYVAGQSVLRGDAVEPFDLLAHGRRQQALFGPEAPVFGWHYPPFFLFIAAPLALLPYLPSLLLWQAGSLLPLLALVRRILPGRLALLAAAAYPAVFVNLGHGHNGFLTALLLGAGLGWMDRRPALAGMAFALLAYKPQFGLVVALLLLLAWRRAMLLAAFGTLAALVVLSLVVFGAASWVAFLDNLAFTRTEVLEAGATGWPKIQSSFAAVRMWGGGVASGYAAQALVSAAVLLAVAVVWRLGGDQRLVMALVPVASVLVTPYALDYDLVVVGLSIAVFAAHGLDRGFRPWEVTGLALAWVAPILSRGVAGATGLPLGLLAMLALFALVVRRAVADRPQAGGAGLNSASAPATG